MKYLFFFVLLSTAIAIDRTKVDCISQFKDQQSCGTNPICHWLIWHPDQCQNQCGYYSDDPERCGGFPNCYYYKDKKLCNTRKCSLCETDECCKANLSCEMRDGKCVDQSCMILQAYNKCNNDYCNYDTKRKLCYDKKCVDYGNYAECNALSFCKWDKYRCVNKDPGQGLDTYSVIVSTLCLFLFTFY